MPVARLAALQQRSWCKDSPGRATPVIPTQRSEVDLVIGSIATNRFLQSALCAPTARRRNEVFGDKPAHQNMANSPNTPTSMSRTATVMAIGRMAS